MKMDDKVTSANAVDIAQEILFSLDPTLRKEELYVFYSQDFVDKYNPPSFFIQRRLVHRYLTETSP